MGNSLTFEAMDRFLLAFVVVAIIATSTHVGGKDIDETEFQKDRIDDLELRSEKNLLKSDLYAYSSGASDILAHEGGLITSGGVDTEQGNSRKEIKNRMPKKKKKKKKKKKCKKDYVRGKFGKCKKKKDCVRGILGKCKKKKQKRG